MQVSAIIGISEGIKDLYQIYKDGVLYGTLHASNTDEAKKICASKYAFPINWRELKAVKIMKS